MIGITLSLSTTELMEVTEQLRSRRDSLREGIAKTITNADSNELLFANLAGKVNELAQVEGNWTVALEVMHHVVSLRQHDITGAAFCADLLVHLSQLATTSDDRWSGRGNDARRSFEDGIREAVKDFTFTVRMELKKF